MIKKTGKIPVNARVSINYEGDKPKIKFSYPSKNALEQNYMGKHSLLILLLGVLLWFCFINFYSIDLETPKECFIQNNTLTQYNTFSVLRMVCDGENKSLYADKEMNLINIDAKYGFYEIGKFKEWLIVGLILALCFLCFF